MRETMIVNGIEYPLTVIREARSNSTASIGRKGIIIRISQSMNREESFRHIIHFKEWARKRLEEKPVRMKNNPLKTYKDGDTITVWGTAFLLKVSEKDTQTSSARVHGDHILFQVSSRLTEEQKQHYITSLLSRSLGQAMLPKLREKIHALNEKHFQQEINSISFKNTSSRWGSCNPKGKNINISTRLFFAPDDVIDSVCIHELAHLVEKNHSERFWSLVEKAMPNYKEKDRWLKENGHTCGF